MKTIGSSLVYMALAVVILMTYSCRKERGTLMDSPKVKGVLDERLVYEKPTTAEQKNLVINLAKITNVIKEVYKNNEALMEVNAAIAANVYTDESILLKDLIYYDGSSLQASKSFNTLASKMNFKPGTFSVAFWVAVNKANDPAFSSFLKKVSSANNSNRLLTATKGNTTTSGYYNQNGYYMDDISIYYPYSEQFNNNYNNYNGYYSGNYWASYNYSNPYYTPQYNYNDPNNYYSYNSYNYQYSNNNYYPLVTVVTAVAEADAAYGLQPSYDSNGNLTYTQVVVDDDYSFNNPTQIIGLNGVELSNENPSGIIATFPAPTVPVAPLPRAVRQVFIGDVRCTKQYDRWISLSDNGGGSEIIFTRADGFLKQADGQVQAADIFFSTNASIGRGDIKKGRWLDWTILWDGDWEADNKEQNLAIYEDDNTNSSSFNVSLKTKVKILGQEGEGSIGGTINYKSLDDIIRQQNHKYDVFFSLNKLAPNPPYDELRNGWFVFDRGSPVTFTLPDRIIQ